MSYASDLGLKVGSKIRLLRGHIFADEGSVVELLRDDGTEIPEFSNQVTGQDCICFDLSVEGGWEHYKEEEKDVTFELKVGDKVEITDTSIFRKDMVKTGDVATYKGGTTFSCPTWDDTQVVDRRLWSNYLKPHVAAKPKTPFGEAGYTAETKFNCLVDYGDFSKGEIVTLQEDDGTSSPRFINAKGDIHRMVLPTDWDAELEVYTVALELKFPCAVPMAEIKNPETFDKIFDLFTANGADECETGYEENLAYRYFGVDYDRDTIFYSNVNSYSFNADDDEEVTIYSVSELLGLVPKEDPVTTETVLVSLLPVGTEVQIARGSQYYNKDDHYNPIDTKGVLISNKSSYYGDEYIYRVRWDDDTTNSYTVKDLVLWNEGWIEWSGEGERPDLEGAKIDAKFRSGAIELDRTPEGYRWNHINGRDIVAYRLHVPATPPVASQEAITECLEDKPSVSMDLSKDAYSEPVYPKVGDKIKIIGNKCYHKFAIGEIVTVVEDGSDDDTPNWRCSNKEDLSYVSSGLVGLGEFELVKEEPYEYKVGDLVEITACKYDHGFDVGQVVRLTSLHGRSFWRAEKLDGSDYWEVEQEEFTLRESTTAEVIPLVSIIKCVTYTVTIKGITVTLTQDELNELSIELDGFEDYE